MKRPRLEEDEAFRRRKKWASDHNRKLVDVAQEIIAAEHVSHALGRP